MRPRPKFCTGEEVIIDAYISTHYNGPCEVLEMVWRDKGLVCGQPRRNYWAYRTTTTGTRFLHERALRKIPPEERTNLIADIWQPKDVEIPA